MTSIFYGGDILALRERTAFSFLKRTYTAQELTLFFSPSDEEVAWAREKTSKATTCLMFLVLLKTFQHLHYFPNLSAIPLSVTLGSAH